MRQYQDFIATSVFGARNPGIHEMTTEFAALACYGATQVDAERV
jgi:hypothetical protein